RGWRGESLEIETEVELEAVPPSQNPIGFNFNFSFKLPRPPPPSRQSRTWQGQHLPQPPPRVDHHHDENPADQQQEPVVEEPLAERNGLRLTVVAVCGRGHRAPPASGRLRPVRGACPWRSRAPVAPRTHVSHDEVLNRPAQDPRWGSTA